MSTQTHPDVAATAPDGPELLRRVRDLHPLIEAEAAEAERLGRLTDPVVEALHEAGVFRMWVPKAFGGSELRPTELIDVLASLAYADGATGWVVMASSMVTGATTAYMPQEASEAMWAKDAPPVIAGHGTKPGTAVPEGDGYRLSGDWMFGSGIRHANHVHSLGIVEGTGQPLIFTTSIDDVELDQDSWDVVGLKATGSLDYTMRDVYVPASWTHDAFTQSAEQGDLYRLGILNFAGICHAGWAVGAGRRALDELAAMVQRKRGRAGTLAESDAFLQGYAETEAAYRAACAWLTEIWTDVEATIYAGEDLSRRQETLIRMAMPHLTFATRDAALFAYRHGGTTALREGPLQRLVRDVHAATQHITSAPAGITAAGRELAGLADGHHWVLMNLVADDA